MLPSKLIYVSENRMCSQPLLSIAIPTYKNKRYLIKAIKSIEDQSEKDLFDYEVVIVSNNTTDTMSDIIQYCKNSELPVSIYINEENYGQVGNVNQCIELSRGKYVSFLHDDDMLLPTFFSIVSRYLKSTQVFPCIVPSYYNMYTDYQTDLKHRFLSAVFFPRFFYRHELQIVRPNDHKFAFDDIYGSPSCGTIFHKQSVCDYGLFRDERGAAWDYYNFREFNKIYEVYLLHRFVGIRRSESGMSSEEKVRQQFLDDMKQMVFQDEADDPFLVAYRETIFSHKPVFKYLFFRIKTKCYYYMRNLDKDIGIPQKLYSQYHD